MGWNHLIAQYLIAVGFFADEVSFPSNSSHLLLYSELSPVKYIQNKRALTALYRSQQCTNKRLFYPRAEEKASKVQYVSSNIWHQGRQKMNWHNKNRLPCKTPLQLEYYNTYSLRLGLSKKRGGYWSNFLALPIFAVTTSRGFTILWQCEENGGMQFWDSNCNPLAPPQTTIRPQTAFHQPALIANSEY